MLFNEALEEYLVWCEWKGFTPKTMKNKNQEYKQLREFLTKKRGVTELGSITHHDLQSYVNLKRQDKLKPQSIHSMFKMVKAFFNWCAIEGYIVSKENPVTKVVLPKIEKKVLNGFSEDEVMKMINAFSYDNYLEARNKSIILILTDCGLRAMEIRGLKESDIKKDENIIIVHGKGNKERYVPVSPALRKALIKYEKLKRNYFKDRFNIEDRYFLTYQGGEISHTSLWNVIVKAGKRAGIKSARVSPHTFRHYYSVKSLENGMDIYTLKQVLGHSEVTTTERYLQTLKNSHMLSKSISSSPLMNMGSGIRI